MPPVFRRHRCSFFYRYLISWADAALLKDLGEDAIPGHYAVAHLAADGAVGVALLADLGHLKKDLTHPQLCADREHRQGDPLGEDVFRKGACGDIGKPLTNALHTLVGKQTHLPVPVARVGVSHDPVVDLQLNFRDRMLYGPFLFTDTDGKYLRHGGFLLNHCL